MGAYFEAAKDLLSKSSIFNPRESRGAHTHIMRAELSFFSSTFDLPESEITSATLSFDLFDYAIDDFVSVKFTLREQAFDEFFVLSNVEREYS